MGFATLEEAQAAYDELKPKYDALETEKTSLLRKRDELLGEVKTLKTKFSKFADYADQDIDIAALLDIKAKFEAGDSDLKTKYEQAYNADKTKFEQRLKAIEDERKAEKEQAERQQKETSAAKLKAEAISEFSKESYRIRNPEQFWRLFGEGKIQRDESGKLYFGDEYKQVSVSEYINQINEDTDNAHHFKPKGGSGSGTGAGTGNGGKVTVNPWKKETRNLTQQGQILRTNPELAARLKAEAGVK
jgi:hypothetical protein